ncbi:MAG: SPOR domain-containing protein [Bacteroidota bacterium]|nr:SPOR domain-containing protein [Bacteroidota bacterium]
MIEKHISELLKTTDRVIIPNFGAFLKSKGEVKSVIFNEFIKFNDGQLIQFVSDQEKISIEEASEKVDQFVEKLKDTLDKGSKFHILDVGLLYQDDKGRLRFDSGEVANDVAIEDEKKEKPEKAKKEPGKTEKKEESKKEEKPSEKKAAAIAAEKKNEKEKIRQPDPRKSHQPEEEEEGKPRYLAAWIIIIVLLVAIIAWLILDWNNIPGYFKQEQKMTDQEQLDEPVKKEQSKAAITEPKDQKPQKQTEKSGEAKPEEIKEEKQKLPEQKAEKPAEVRTPLSGPAKKYHLIAGVFGEEKNADKLLSKLRSEGFYPEKLGKINGLYYVTYNSFKKKQDAKYELKRLYDKGFEVWLYFY